MAVIRAVVSASIPGGSASHTVTTDDSPQVGDLMVAMHGADYFSVDDIQATTDANGGVWTLRAAGDAGDNNCHVKVWTSPVSVAGAQSVTFHLAARGDEHEGALWVIGGVEFDDAAGTGATGGTTLPAPSVTATGAGLLICHWQMGLTSATPVNGTVPPSMTQHYNLVQNAGFTRMIGASETVSSAGDTGTRALTTNKDDGWAAISIALKDTGGATSETHALSATVSLELAAQTGLAKRAGMAASPPLGVGASAGEAKTASMAAHTPTELAVGAAQAKTGSLSASAALALDVDVAQTKRAAMLVLSPLTLGVVAILVSQAPGHLAAPAALALATAPALHKHGGLAAGTPLALGVSVALVEHTILTTDVALALDAAAAQAKHARVAGAVPMTLAVAAVARNPNAVRRDLRIIVGPLTSSWDTAAPVSGWSAHAPVGNEWATDEPTSGWSAGTVTT